MQKSKTLSKLFNIFLPFTDFLYILQLEEYSTKRLLKWLPKFFFRRNIEQRERLILTKKALILLTFSFFMWIVAASIGVYVFRESLILIFITFFILANLTPFFVLIANFIFSLYEEFPKKRLRNLAAQKVKNNQDMKVIVVAGSYGKTTVKNFIEQFTRYSFKTQMLPGNINTPGGIANWIIGNLGENTELLIAEVDAYEVGEIAKSCDMLNADIAVLTNIGDQHMERFGSKENLARALSEVFTHSKSEAARICTSDTKDTIRGIIGDEIQLQLLPEKEKITYRNESAPKIELSESNLINLRFALLVAEQLHVRNDFIMDSITHLELPERRQQATTVLEFNGIDDSYNISFSTAQAGISEARKLATQNNKKLLVITAGIPELSKENTDKNQELGRILSDSADYTVILGSMFSEEIKNGFGTSDQYTIITTLRDFVTNESDKYDKNEWFLLLQPELNDLYY